MSVRLVLTVTALPGKGSEVARAYRMRCATVVKEPGFEQYEVFQSIDDPDRLVVLERWADQAALDAHEAHNRAHPLAVDWEKLRPGRPEREDYIYNRVR